MKIKYLDQIIITGKFQAVDQIKAVKPRVVEAVGYLVKEDETGYTLASTINGGGYNNLLFIPKAAVLEVENDSNGLEIEYIEAQGMGNKFISKEKIDTLPKPPPVKVCGFEVFKDENTLYLAQEKNEDGNYRTITAIPIKFLV